MSTILRARFLCLDTSTLMDLSYDSMSSDRKKRESVRSFLKQLTSIGWYITLTNEHLRELAQNYNNEIMIERFKFLRSIDPLAWIRNTEGTKIRCLSDVGSFMDIDCFEIQQIVEYKKLDHHSIISQVRDNLFSFGTGFELFRDSRDEWELFADANKPLLEKSQNTASILKANTGYQAGKKKLKDIKGETIPHSESVANLLDQGTITMAESIKKHGDKRVEAPDDLATNFFSGVSGMLNSLHDASRDQESGDLIEVLSERFDLEMDAIDPEMTESEFTDLVNFAMNLKIYNRKIKREPPITVQDINANQLPSWSLRKLLSKWQSDEDYVKGSDIIDGFIASLIPYFDSCQVDKRTHNILNKIRNRSEFISDSDHYFKSSHYSDIIDQLPK